MKDQRSTDGETGRILEGLASSDPQQAWTDFLELFSPIIFQVVKLAEREPEHRTDCFLFVCAQLCQDRFRRLRRFKPEGKARFTTWLQVVVRNLCHDWHRKEFGRQRVFQSIARLPALDQDIFRAVYLQRLSADACLFRLRGTNPDLTPKQVEESLERLQQALTPRQIWLLNTRYPRLESLHGKAGEEQEISAQIPDGRPDPEAWSVMQEQRASLARSA